MTAHSNRPSLFGKRDEFIYALFDSQKAVENALKKLIDADIPVENISLLMSEDVHDKDFKALERTMAPRGAVAGALLGGTIGGVIGGLTALGTALSGVALIVAGPLLALAASGGLLGALIGHGIPEEEAKRVHDEIHAGKALIAVHSQKTWQIHEAEKVFAELHGELVDFDHQARI